MPHHMGEISTTPSFIAKIVVVLVLATAVTSFGRWTFSRPPSTEKPTGDTTTTEYYVEASPGMKLGPGKSTIGMPPGSYTGCFVAPIGWHVTEDHDQRYDLNLEIRGDCAKDGVGYLSTSFSPGYKVKSFSARNKGGQPASVTVWLRRI